MPIYEYRCPECESHFDVRRSFSDQAPVACPQCSAEAKRVYTTFTMGAPSQGPRGPMDHLKETPEGRKMAAMADKAVDSVLRKIQSKRS